MSVCLQVRIGGTIMTKATRGPVTFTKCTFLNSSLSRIEEKLLSSNKRSYQDKPWYRHYEYERDVLSWDEDEGTGDGKVVCHVLDIRNLKKIECFVGLIVYAKFNNPVDTFPNMLSFTDCVLDSSKVCRLVACALTVYVCLMRVLAPRCHMQTVALQ